MTLIEQENKSKCLDCNEPPSTHASLLIYREGLLDRRMELYFCDGCIKEFWKKWGSSPNMQIVLEDFSTEKLTTA